MSLILDALRKMEQERKSRRHERSDIRPEVLRYQGVPAKTSGLPRLLPVSGAIILVIACIGWWFLFKDARPDVEKSPAYPSPQTTATKEPVQANQAPPPQATALPLAVQQPTDNPLSRPPQPSPKTENAASQAADSSATAHGITISGIAYQDERSLRRAVINGLLVSEGSEVSGALIVEILENRVKFSRGGQSFEIIHSSSLPR